MVVSPEKPSGGKAVSQRSTEDLLSMARRHVAEGEAHVARQEALIVKLDRDGHTQLAVEARELLTTLQTSLRLTYEDLLWIENQSRRQEPPSKSKKASRRGSLAGE
jgi:hypothetical protein